MVPSVTSIFNYVPKLCSFCVGSHKSRAVSRISSRGGSGSDIKNSDVLWGNWGMLFGVWPTENEAQGGRGEPLKYGPA